MSSGWSALVLCLMLGKRLGFGKVVMAPHSLGLCMVARACSGWAGTASTPAARWRPTASAANAFATTTLAAAVASFTWGGIEWMHKGKPSVLGFCSGAVGGLVVITPACGFVTPNSAVLIGIIAGAVRSLPAPAQTEDGL
jgi:Amt family ammonium transporter